MPMFISPFLRNALIADAVVSGAAALLMAFGADLVADITGLPPRLLLWAGAVLFPFVALLAITARRETAPRSLLGFIVLANIAWVVASVVLLVSGSVAPNALGYGFVIAQALAVGLFAELQFIGLRRSAATA